MSAVPVELLVDVLIRLPVKSLIRFRCVSKSIRALIDSPNFIRWHIDYSTKTNSNLTIINSACCKIFSIELDKLEFSRKIDGCIPGSLGLIAGSCNGLILTGNDRELITLWNPSTRKYLNLPVIPGIEVDAYRPRQMVGGIEFDAYPPRKMVGLGYDHSTDDYKVVRVVQRMIGTDYLLNEAMVYSLRSNSWRMIQNFPYSFGFRDEYGTFVGNAVHWIAYRGDGDLIIVAFDLGTEECTLLPLPVTVAASFGSVGSHQVRLGCIGSLGGSLCFYRSSCSSNYSDIEVSNDFHIEVWIMKEYGVNKSWTKLIFDTRPASERYNYENVLTYSKCGRRLLFDTLTGFLWYDLETNAVEPISLVGKVYISTVCVGSLVKLGDDDNGNGESHEIKKLYGEKKVMDEVKHNKDY